MVGQRGEHVAGVVRGAIETFQTLLGGVTDLIRAGDSTVKDLDSALTGSPSAGPSTPEQSFLEVVALMQAAMVEAGEAGSASAPAVVQRAREILGRVSREEPAWRPAPSVIRTVNDVFRTALRDLRASQDLVKLAQGNGTLDDLEKLSQWADDLTDRLAKTQKIVAQPKPSKEPPVPAASAPGSVESSSSISSSAPEAEPAPAPQARKPRKRSTTPKAKGNPEDIAFAQAVAAELGDTKVNGWAQDLADGKISEKQWITRLTTHAAASRDSLEDVFARATERVTRDARAK